MYVIFICILLTFVSSAQVVKNQEKELFLKKTSSSIIIDGQIDDAWSEADSITKFFQLQPYFNQPPSVNTVVKVLTTDDALHSLFICYQNKDDMQISSGLLDDFTGDGVSIMLDTFNDKQTAYNFDVIVS